MLKHRLKIFLRTAWAHLLFHTGLHRLGARRTRGRYVKCACATCGWTLTDHNITKSLTTPPTTEPSNTPTPTPSGDTEARYHHELCGGTPLNKYCS